MSIPTFEFPPSFEFLLQASWQGGLLVFVVLGMQRILRRQLTPAWRHALWWVVLGRLLIPITPPSTWSLFNLTPTTTRPSILSPDSFTSTSGWLQVVATSAWGPSVDKLAPTSVFTVDREATPPAVSPGTSPARSLGGAMTLVWGVGALVLLGRIGLQNLWFARRVRGLMRPADPDLLAMLDECRVRMGIQRRIDLLQGDAVSSPAVFGMLRPRILLPLSLARTCPPDQLRHILLHELAHVRRGDSLVHGLTRVLQALHWFNPVLAWAFRRLRADREIATDALALEVAGEQESRAYGLTIVELLQKWVAHPTQPNTVGILEDGSSLERRIRAIATYRRPSRWASLASLVVAALAAVSWTSAQTDGSPKPASLNPAVGTEPTKQLLKEATQQREIGNLDAAQRKVESAIQLDPKNERQRIVALLESIRIPEVGFDRRPLEEVVRKLKDMARAHDPEGKGMNFFMNPYLDFVPGPDLGGGIDPEAGRTNQPAAIEPPRLNDVLVRIDPPLRDVRMLDVLRALTLSASVPILFTVEEYAVVFAHKPPRHARLLTRVFRTNPERLSNGLESTHRILGKTNVLESTDVPGTSPTIQEKVQQFFQELGVSLLPPNAMFFNDRLGLLMVRASLEEMETVETAIEAINQGSRPVWLEDSTNAPPALKPVQPQGANPITNPPAAAAGSNGNAPNKGATAERAGDFRSADSRGALGQSEPAYEGKTLSAWLKELVESPAWSLYGVNESNQPPITAIRAIGPRAVPFLLNGFGPDTDSLVRACHGFRALGRMGEAAIPNLLRWVDRYPGYAPGALASIGAPAVPALLECLNNKKAFGDLVLIPGNTMGGIFNAISLGGHSAAEFLPLLPIIRELATSDNAHAVLYAEKVLKVLEAESDQSKERASVEGGFKYCAQVEIVAMPLQSIPHVLRKSFESSARGDDPRILRTAVSAARSATRTDAKGNMRSWTNNPVFVRIWVGGNSTNDALRSARMSADQLAKRLGSGKGTETDVVEVPHSVRPVTWRYDSLEPFLGRIFGKSR